MNLRIFTSVIAVCAGLAFAGCREDAILNANIVPSGDTVNTRRIPDTLTILSDTYFDDSVATSVNFIFPALGTLASDIAWTGKTHAGIYFQLIPPTFGFTFPKDIDSAVLILPYAGFTWGDTTSQNMAQTFRLYEMADSLSKDSVYYSKTIKAVDRSRLLGEATVTYKTLKDSVYATGSNRAPHLRIRITDQDFVSKIRNSTATESAADFIRFLKGLYVEPADTNTGNALYYFRIDGTNEYSRVNLLCYYTDKTADDKDTLKTASFFFNPTYTTYYNRITRNYTGSNIAHLMTSTDTDSVFVIQNEPGAVLDLKFPYIKHLPQVPVNKAELVITQFSFGGDQTDVYTMPERIYPSGVNSSGETYTILDRYPINSNEPLTFMGGERKSVTIGSMTISQYVLNIPREVQSAIVEQRDILHLRINGAGQYPGAFRLVGAGRTFSNSTMRVQLNIVYSTN